LTPRADARGGAPEGFGTGLCVDADGRVTGRVAESAPPVRFVASPNVDERPAGAAIELLVIHAISLPPGEFGGSAIEALFLNRLDPGAHPYYAGIARLRVSAHFLVRRDGALVQFVPCVRRAWHAGESSWRGRPRCNDFSIGVELEGADDVAFEDAQYATLGALTTALAAVYPLIDAVGHSDIAPGRKTDPGPFFEWPRFHAASAVTFPPR
jgi:AmpD protein